MPYFTGSYHFHKAQSSEDRPDFQSVIIFHTTFSDVYVDGERLVTSRTVTVDYLPSL